MHRLRHFLIAGLSVLLIGLAGLAAAQLNDRQKDYYQTWLKTADRAEEVVDENRASNAALENLRSEIDQYRDIFNTVRGQNAERIHTLQSQLDALGPKPEDGSDEPGDIAALRSQLEEQLNELKVPRIIGEEAFSRANGLINEIDRIIRERQTKRLLSRGPSPLNPKSWAPAARDVEEAVRGLTNEIRANVKNDIVRAETRTRGLEILILIVMGVVLIARGRRWSERLGNFLRSWGGQGSGVWGFIVSLSRILLPWFGVVSLVTAVSITGLLGVRGQLLLEQVPVWAATFFYFDWIGRQLFLIWEEDGIPNLTRARLAEVRVVIDLLAVVLILFDIVNLIEQIENIPEASGSVMAFPVILLGALVLLRLQQISPRRGSPVDGEDDARRPGFSKLVRIVRRILVIMGLITPVMAAFGFVDAAESIVFPAIKTLALISVIVIFQRFLGNLYGWLTGKGAEGRDSLFSVIAGFVLTVMALPILALYWGAREADLSEAWSQLLLGVEVGDTRVSPTTFLTLALIFAVGYIVTRLMQSGLRNSLLPKTNLDPGGQNAIVSGTGYVGITLAALAAVTGAGLDLSSLAIVAGALSVGIGFGLQTIVSNFVSGIILLVERPISKGDWIDVNGQMGYVRDISVRSTRIETFDRTDVIVPNSDLIAGTVTNYTRGNTVGRVIVPVGVAYGTDTRRVERILTEIANAHPMVLANPAPFVAFQGFGADSLDFEIRAILRDVNWVLAVKTDMNHEIAKRFTEEEIEIPFAQRDVWLRNPETLRDQQVRPSTTETAEQPSEPRPMGKAQITDSDLDGEGNGDY